MFIFKFRKKKRWILATLNLLKNLFLMFIFVVCVDLKFIIIIIIIIIIIKPWYFLINWYFEQATQKMKWKINEFSNRCLKNTKQ